METVVGLAGFLVLYLLYRLWRFAPRVMNFAAAMLAITAAGASVTALAVNGETDAAWFTAILAALAALILSTPLGRVRVAIALGWTLAVVILPLMIFTIEDDAGKGRYVTAGVEAAGDLYLAARWMNWMDRLRARRAQLIASHGPTLPNADRRTRYARQSRDAAQPRR